MPTYSYRCTVCEHAFDAVLPITAPGLTECPACGGKLRRLYDPVGVSFNGSGFYRTDSRAASAASKSSGKSSGTEAPSGSSEAKPTSAGATPAGERSPSRSSATTSTSTPTSTKASSGD